MASNMLPRAVVELAEAALQGDVAEAARQQLALQPLISALFCETSPIPVKAAMRSWASARKLFACPLYPCSPKAARAWRKSCVICG